MVLGGELAGLPRSAPDEITDNQNISIVRHFLTQSPSYHHITRGRERFIFIMDPDCAVENLGSITVKVTVG